MLLGYTDANGVSYCIRPEAMYILSCDGVTIDAGLDWQIDSLAIHKS
jgi:hypothetical protein